MLQAETISHGAQRRSRKPASFSSHCRELGAKTKPPCGPPEINCLHYTAYSSAYVVPELDSSEMVYSKTSINGLSPAASK